MSRTAVRIAAVVLAVSLLLGGGTERLLATGSSPEGTEAAPLVLEQVYGQSQEETVYIYAFGRRGHFGETAALRGYAAAQPTASIRFSPLAYSDQPAENEAALSELLERLYTEGGFQRLILTNPGFGSARAVQDFCQKHPGIRVFVSAPEEGVEAFRGLAEQCLDLDFERQRYTVPYNLKYLGCWSVQFVIRERQYKLGSYARLITGMREQSEALQLEFKLRVLPDYSEQRFGTYENYRSHLNGELRKYLTDWYGIYTPDPELTRDILEIIPERNNFFLEHPTNALGDWLSEAQYGRRALAYVRSTDGHLSWVQERRELDQALKQHYYPDRIAAWTSPYPYLAAELALAWAGESDGAQWQSKMQNYMRSFEVQLQMDETGVCRLAQSYYAFGRGDLGDLDLPLDTLTKLSQGTAPEAGASAPDQAAAEETKATVTEASAT